MTLIDLTESHQQTLMSWFNSQAEVTEWAGPNLKFPFNKDCFRQDLKLDEWHSSAMITAQSEMVAFGQCYKRLERCHLARLAVSPTHRGKGFAADLIRLITQRGMADLNTGTCSLFVFENNKPAIAAYLKFGFNFAEYPAEMPIENCLYMIRRWS